MLIWNIVDYIVMISLCFFILPFTYFYSEETLDSEDNFDFDFSYDSDEDDERKSTKHSTTSSKKKKSN